MDHKAKEAEMPQGVACLEIRFSGLSAALRPIETERNHMGREASIAEVWKVRMDAMCKQPGSGRRVGSGERPGRAPL